MLVCYHSFEDPGGLLFKIPLLKVVDDADVVDHVGFLSWLELSKLTVWAALPLDDQKRVVHDSHLIQKVDVAGQDVFEHAGFVFLDV